MSLTKLTENLNNVSSLPNQPAMAADELKSVFDKSGNTIKEYINNKLTSEIEELITTKVNEAKITVENILTSTSTVNALSANAGRELQENITELDEKIVSETHDSGWITVDNISNDFNLYVDNEDNRPRYRKIGKFVEIQGAVTPSHELDTNTQYTIFTLPEGYRPSRYQARICQGTGANVWLLAIQITGEVTMSRYRNSSSYGTANAGNWLPFNAVFSTD